MSAGRSWFRHSQTVSEPDLPRDLRFHRTGKVSGFQPRTGAFRLGAQGIAQRQPHVMAGRNFHQAAGYVHGISGRGDVLMVPAAEPGGDDRSEMRADLEADAGRDRRRQCFDPALGPDAEPDRAFGRARGVIGLRPGKAEQNHGAVTEKTGDHAAASGCLLVDERVKILQERACDIRAEGFAERCEAGKVDEHHGGVLPDRLQQEVRIARQPFLQVRRLELFEQSGLRGEMLRASPAGPELHGAEQHQRRRGRSDRRRGVEPYAVGECRRIRGRPYQHNRGDGDEADGVAPPGEQADQQHRKQDRGRRLDDAHRPVAHDAVARDQMGDGGGDDFDAGHQGIERRGKEVAGAGRGRAEHDNPAPDGVAIDLTANDAGGADGTNGAARAVIGDRQRIAGSGCDRAVAEQQAIRRDGQWLADRH